MYAEHQPRWVHRTSFKSLPSLNFETHGAVVAATRRNIGPFADLKMCFQPVMWDSTGVQLPAFQSQIDLVPGYIDRSERPLNGMQRPSR